MTTKGPAAALVLADGTCFRGTGFGHLAAEEEPALGELVFNTSMYGYQEILSDPSYAGQIMCFTSPHIGNVGCNPDDNECDTVYVRGVVVRSASSIVSNFRARTSLADYLASHRIMGISGIDTRALAKHLRTHGAQMGAMASGDCDPEKLQAHAEQAGSMLGKDYVSDVTCSEPYGWATLPFQLESNAFRTLDPNESWQRPHVVVLDCGVKQNILRLLLEAGFRITVLPAFSSSEEILAAKPDALFLSNGPGDPAALPGIVETVRSLLGRLPLFGICLGHQILALACGAKTFKLKFGHRGANHPVLEKEKGRVEITTQNHGFAVSWDGIPDTVQVTHVNLNDNTVSGIWVPGKQAFGVQFHPEASAGPHDSQHLFQRFYEMVVNPQKVNEKEMAHAEAN